MTSSSSSSSSCFSHNIVSIDHFITILQNCMTWSDTIRIEIDRHGCLTMDVSDPEAMGCMTIKNRQSSKDERDPFSIHHIFLIDQVITTLQMFENTPSVNILFQMSRDKAKFIHAQHTYITQEIPICDYRPLYRFCHIDIPGESTSSAVSSASAASAAFASYYQLQFPVQEWNYMINTFCIFAGSRGSPLQYKIMPEAECGVYKLTMNIRSDAGHTVTMNIQGKATTDIPFIHVSSSSSSSSIIEGQVLLHSLLNATKVMNGSTMTLYINQKGLYQQFILPNSPHYITHVFHVSVPNIDPDSFS